MWDCPLRGKKENSVRHSVLSLCHCFLCWRFGMQLVANFTGFTRFQSFQLPVPDRFVPYQGVAGLQYKVYAFNVLNRQHTLSFFSSSLIQSDTNAFISSFNYYTSCSRSSSSYQCSIHQAHTRPCLRWSVKYIVLGSHFFLTPFTLALVPIVQQIQDDLFDGGECGDDVLIFCLWDNFTVLTFFFFCNAGPLRSSSCVPWCYGILDSWCVSLSSFKFIVNNLCFCRWKVSILQVSPFNFF